MERQILHVDVNNAFLSWTAIEMLKNGAEVDIRTIPAIIGGDESQRKGVVLAKSMPAKQFGIKTGEPIYFARQKCNALKVYKGEYGVYRKYSEQLYQLLLEYTDQIERYSIDECFLDMTQFLMNSTLIEKAKEIQKRVREELGFTVNIGVSNNKLLAKMASDFEKPDKVHTLFKTEIKDKMWKLPVRDLFMIGRKTVPKLYYMNIKTIGDLANYDQKDLIKKFGKHGKLIWEYANGIDYSIVNAKEELPKGIGNSVTLPNDLQKIEDIEKIILALVELVTYRLRKYNMLASVVNLQLRTKEFKDYSHQTKLHIATASTKEIYDISKKLLKEMYNYEPIRLIGVRVDHLVSENESQISLFESSNHKKLKTLDKTIDKLKDKYGYTAIKRAGNMEIDDISNLKHE